MIPARYKLLLTVAYTAGVDARIGFGCCIHSGAQNRALTGRRHEIMQSHRRHATIMSILRGGGSGIEANPEYEVSNNDDDSDTSDDEEKEIIANSETDDGGSDNEDDSDIDCTDAGSKDDLHDVSEDEEDAIKTKPKRHYRHPKIIIASSSSSKHSKTSKGSSVNKRIRKIVKRNQMSIYMILAIIAFRQEIIKFILRVLPTTIDPETGKRKLAIRWSTDVLKLVILASLGVEFMRRHVIISDDSSSNYLVKEDEDENDNMKNRTQSSMDQSLTSTSRPSNNKPILPVLILLLSLAFVYPALRRNFTMFSYFLLPIIIQTISSGESNPDSPLGRLMLTMFGRGDTDLVTRMAYMPPLEQHFAFEQLNERYYRDWGAWRKAFPTNSMVTGPSSSSGVLEGGEAAASGSRSRFDSGGGSSMASMMASLLVSRRRKSFPIQPSRMASKSTLTNILPLAKTFPSKYDNGTVIVLDMTKLDIKASRMEAVREQISFLIQMAQSEDSSFFSGPAEKKNQDTGTSINATETKNLTSSNSTITGSNESELSSEESMSQPTVEVIVLLESPGGGVSQYGLAASHLQRLRSTPNIKLTICIDEVAASGGYMMACMASPGQLYCAPFAMVGSIGVIGQSLNVQKTLESYGIRPYVFRGGKMKNPVGMVGDVTKEGVAAMQESIDRIHDAFRSHVKSARKEAFTEAMLSDEMIPKPSGGYFQMGNDQGAATASIEQVMDQVATGDVFLGMQALKLGLVDRLITSDEYIAERIRQGSRVLKLVNYHRQSMGLSSLLAPPGHRGQLLSSSTTAGGIGMVRMLKRIVQKMTMALLAWTEDGLASGSDSIISAGGVVDDIHLQ